MPPGFVVGSVPEAGRQLWTGHGWRRLGLDVANHSVARVRLGNLPSEVLVHGTGTDEEKVLVAWEPRNDGVEESSEMLEPARLGGRLHRATTAVTNQRIVPDVAGTPVTGRNIQFDPLVPGGTLDPAYDDRLASVQPDQRCRCGVHHPRVRGGIHHMWAQAGRSPASSARLA